MLKTFRVKDGLHYGATDPAIKDFHAPRLEKGQLVQSEHDLDLCFREKFERYIPPVVEIPQQVPDLSAAPPSTPTKRQSRTVPPPTQSAPTTASVTADDADDAGPVGKDVTTSYPKAMEQDYKVYLYKGQCTIYNGDDLAMGITKPLNVNPIPTDQVDMAVAKLLRAQPV